MAALGNSLTVPFNGYTDVPANSWSTGTSPAVQSHYLRILAASPGIKGKAYNLAVGGAGFAEMTQQARIAVSRHVGYVTIWGGDDWCGVSDLKPLELELGSLLSILSQAKPRPLVFLASVRNPASIFRAMTAHRSKVLRDFPTGAPILLCGLGVGATKARDSKPADVAAASASIARVNQTIGRVCRRSPGCRFDGNAVYRMPLALTDLADDFDHLTLAGERHVAAVTWAATFPFGR